MKIDNYVPKDKRRQVSDKRIRNLKILSKVAILTSSLMYVAYISEIMQNFSGNPVSPLQPCVATINATLWTFYGWYKTYRDWPLVISNVPGVFFGFFTLITIYIH
ncbi:membrane protein [Philodulcilactobacillus myokoensis]|uniref:Membrane protein n=1 Tax=Philodulcilactobacillus myokoensis TaxID=2929573 RepID=A0A9W6B2C2_9LACO|nr:SemiSWEET family transporter [Philodulcilactobacillus myokoensis]GLB47373.1 membrane protein [Philodulcilactobacillus myokoensis]